MSYFFSGTIDRIIFENASNFFKIILLEIEESDSDYAEPEIIITGTMGDLLEGEDYTFWGELVQHPKYGQQLKLERYERSKPSQSGLIKYFSGEHFKGIGKKTAEKIVDLYGDDPIDSILEDPSKLDHISGLSKVNKEKFIAKLKLNYGTEQILTKLATYGITSKIALQIFNHYQEESLDILQQTPYQLVEDIKGIGFKMADQLAEQVGIASDDPQRFRAALLHVLLETSLEEGDTYLEARQLLERSLYLLEDSRQIELDPSLIAKELSNLIAEDKIQHIDTKIFDNTLFYAEEGIHKHLTRLLETKTSLSFSEQKIEETIDSIEEDLNLSYDSIQREAIHKALSNKVFILTGGPGTGKTTVINGIIEAYARLRRINLKKEESPILLAAPTGRAARRMNELTGLPSATIHRHLGLTGDSDDFQTLDDYLDADLIIVDEFSMVDTWLANQLLSAISSNTQLIIVGDSDQLPSVGPGQVLADLLKIAELPQIALTKIFRQSDDSTIVTLASHIRQGQLPHDFRDKKADRSYFEANANVIPNMVEKIVQSAIKSGISPSEIQILAPMYRGQAGINNLNQLLQDLINPLDDSVEFLFNETRFRKNDKVLHLINDAESNVFNGDIGYITDLIPAKYTESKQDEIYLDFDGTEVIYPRNEWSKITLAYAMSIHKSQGSEFQVVILPITRQSGRMLQRNLIYTAITRSKSKLILLGEYQAFDYAVQNEGAKRRTYLIQRFQPDDTPSQESSDQLIHSDVDKPSDKEPQNNPQIETKTVKEPYYDKDSNNDRSNEEIYSQLVDNSVDKSVNSVNKPTEYRLSEENWSSIDPLIGLTQTDFDLFFRKDNI
ncbi:ATP-dependent RecD-like DNA helicase [Streptococcus saliviloxodontae]|uniref:ATP-dependent RecD2 DNA helicase n=1 Tax=Streptococcus saliviloxodontae TaxID=1349416 RepID=A0ABS2PIV7_9STRE|nr:ATP-dependent RecD-like DNA helicase [Streptococcus saliviloxodontae]MBM7635294.1 exodeoxyribonuclease V alpha subunit [Streptococcus saliviloxodontae]